MSKIDQHNIEQKWAEIAGGIEAPDAHLISIAVDKTASPVARAEARKELRFELTRQLLAIADTLAALRAEEEGVA